MLCFFYVFIENRNFFSLLIDFLLPNRSSEAEKEENFNFKSNFLTRRTKKKHLADFQFFIFDFNFKITSRWPRRPQEEGKVIIFLILFFILLLYEFELKHKKNIKISSIATLCVFDIARPIVEPSREREREKMSWRDVVQGFLSANIAFIESAKNYNYNATGPSDKYSLLLLLLLHPFIDFPTPTISLGRFSTLHADLTCIKPKETSATRDGKKTAAAANSSENIIFQ